MLSFLISTHFPPQRKLLLVMNLTIKLIEKLYFRLLV